MLHTGDIHSSPMLHTGDIHSSPMLHTGDIHSSPMLHTGNIHSSPMLHTGNIHSSPMLHTGDIHSSPMLHTGDIHSSPMLHTGNIHSSPMLHTCDLHSSPMLQVTWRKMPFLLTRASWLPWRRTIKLPNNYCGNSRPNNWQGKRISDPVSGPFSNKLILHLVIERFPSFLTCLLNCRRRCPVIFNQKEVTVDGQGDEGTFFIPIWSEVNHLAVMNTLVIITTLSVNVTTET